MGFNAKRFDTSAFTDGVWVHIMDGEFKIARAGNPEFEQALEDSGYRKIDDQADKQRALYKAIARGVLKDWREVEDDKGQAIPFTTENVVEVLLDNPDLVGRLLNEANDLSNWKREDVAAQKKRRSTSSAGKAATSE